MKGIPKVGVYMTFFPFSVGLKDTVAKALDLMKENRIRHLPVVADGLPKSIITEREINQVLSILKQESPDESLLVEDACAIEAYMAEADTRLDIVLDEMVRRHIGSAIITKDGRLAGIFTYTDACHHFSEFLKKHYGPNKPGSDAA